MKDVKTLVMILGIVVSLGVGFGGGYLFKAQQVSRMRQNLVGQFQGRVGMERNGNGMGIQNKGGGGIRGTMGEIISQDEKSITVKTVDGSSRIVILSDSTTYSEEKTTKKNNLKTEKETKENVEKIHGELKALRDALKPIDKERAEIHDLLDERFKKLSEERSSVVFYVSLFTALLLIIASLFIPVPAISVGLILSGIAVGIDGYWRTWNYLDARLKFISLIIAIVLLIAISFISFYRSKDKKRKK